jgi:hypothetical protein
MKSVFLANLVATNLDRFFSQLQVEGDYSSARTSESPSVLVRHGISDQDIEGGSDHLRKFGKTSYMIIFDCWKNILHDQRCIRHFQVAQIFLELG